MRLVFLSDQFYPKSSADTEQIISSLSAMSKIVKVTFVFAAYKNFIPSKKNIEQYYNKSCDFTIQYVVHRFKNIRGIEKLLFAIAILKKIKNKEYEVSYTRNIPILLSILLFSKLPIIFESYRPWPDRNFLAKMLFKWLNKNKRLLGIVLHSKYAGKSFSNIGFSDEKLFIAHNAFKSDEYIVKSKASLCKKYQLPQDRIILTYSGRVTKEKGVDRLFEVAKAFPELSILIIGSERKGEIEKHASIYPNIIVLDWMPKNEVYSLLAISDILYIPPTKKARDISKNTVLPLKTFLYKATGTSILAPNLEDIREVLCHNRNAYLIEPDNLNSELLAINTLINDSTLRNRLGSSAKQDMEHLTWDNRAEFIKNFIHTRYNTLIKNNNYFHN